MGRLGEPHEIARAYNELNFGRLIHDDVESGRYGDQIACEIEDAWFETRRRARPRDRAGRAARDRAAGALPSSRSSDPIVAVALRNEVGHTVFSTSTSWRLATGRLRGRRAGRDPHRARHLARAEPLQAHAVDRARRCGADALDLREDLVSLLVHSTRITGGIVDVPHAIEVQRP